MVFCLYIVSIQSPFIDGDNEESNRGERVIILKRYGVLWIGVAKEIVHKINLNTILLK